MNEQNTPLQEANGWKHEDLAKELNPPIHTLMRKYYQKVTCARVKQSLASSSKEQIEEKDKGGTIFHYALKAIHSGNKEGPEILQVLLEAKLEAKLELLLKLDNRKPPTNALILAAKLRLDNALIPIINMIKSIDPKNWHINLKVPFHQAVSTQNWELVGKLISIYPDLALTKIHQRTVLHLAVETGDFPIVEKLVEIIPEDKVARLLETANQDHKTPLHLACGRRGHDITQILIAKCPDNRREKVLLKQDRSGWGPLHWAANQGQFSAIRLLIEKLPENARRTVLFLTDRDGLTVLHTLITSVFEVDQEQESEEESEEEFEEESGEESEEEVEEESEDKSEDKSKDTKFKVVKFLVDSCPDIGAILDKKYFSAYRTAKERRAEKSMAGGISTFLLVQA